MLAFIKDGNELNGRTKALVRLMGGTINEDRLTKATSSFNVLETPNNLNNGDTMIVYNDKGKQLYKGIVSSYDLVSMKTNQYQAVYSGNTIYQTNNTIDNLEGEIAWVYGQFASGYIKNSTYQDTLMKKRLEPIKITTGSTTIGNLLTKQDNTVIDMEQFIYDCYKDYDIVFDFGIPKNQWQVGDDDGFVKIWKPSYSSLKITDGFSCISSIKSTNETQNDNKLVIYSNDGEYRKTYYSTINGILEEPISDVGRSNIIKTKIVFSNDELSDIVNANLKDTMYEHKIQFAFDTNSKLFTFDDFKLDLPIQVYDNKDYYNTIITGRSFSFDENDVISNVIYTCGKVRTSLTSKMLLGIVK